jgi:DUF971 family protein
MNPIQIKIKDKDKLYIKWNDDTESTIMLKLLRDECPCATCKGETVLFKTYRPPTQQPKSEFSYQVKGIEQVGNYAIQVHWKDGHNTGFYNWDYLRKLAETEAGDN